MKAGFSDVTPNEKEALSCGPGRGKACGPSTAGKAPALVQSCEETGIITQKKSVGTTQT